jgi:hypothetical protein
MIVGKYGDYVRKFMWQLCRWGRVDNCMTFHKRAFNFFISLHVDLTILKIARHNTDDQSCNPVVRSQSTLQRQLRRQI